MSLRTRLDLAFRHLAGGAAMPCRENWIVIDSLLISLQRRPTSACGLAHQQDASSRLDPLGYMDRSCEEDVNSRRPDVVCLWRPFAGTGTHCSTVDLRARPSSPPSPRACDIASGDGTFIIRGGSGGQLLGPPMRGVPLPPWLVDGGGISFRAVLDRDRSGGIS